METKERTLYTPPGLEMVELKNEQGFATTGGTSPFENDGQGSWND